MDDKKISRALDVAMTAEAKVRIAKEEQADIIVAEAKKMCRTYGEVEELLECVSDKLRRWDNNGDHRMYNEQIYEVGRLISEARSRVRAEQGRLPLADGPVWGD